VPAVAVLDRDHEALPVLAPGCERQVVPLDAKRHVAADEAQRLVPQQHAREKAGLAQDLEAVADPDHVTASRRVPARRGSGGGEPRDRAATEVVAVREPARHDDGVETGEVALLVPDRYRLRAERGQRPERISIVLRAGVRDDADARTTGQSPPRTTR